jgi:hypothetical protein
LSGVIDVWHIPANDEADEFWERLGRGDDLGESEKWIRIDGMLDNATVYFRRAIADAGPAKITGITVIGTELTAEMLRSIPMGRLENFDQAFIADMTVDQLEVIRRDNYDDPADFAEAVAFNYRFFATRTDAPTKALAEHSGMPVTTVRGWVREARLRGLLAPGRRGKAG